MLEGKGNVLVDYTGVLKDIFRDFIFPLTINSKLT